MAGKKEKRVGYERTSSNQLRVVEVGAEGDGNRTICSLKTMDSSERKMVCCAG